MRVGSQNRQADAAAVADLQRAVRGRSIDEEPMPELNSEAIDFRAASECFAPVRRLNRRELHSLQLTVHHEVPEFPVVAKREAIVNALAHADCAQRGSGFGAFESITVSNSASTRAEPFRAGLQFPQAIVYWR